MTEEENPMSTQVEQKYAHLKNKMNEISKGAKLLTGEGNMVKLDPKNPYHKEWFEKDKYKGE